MYYDTCGVMWPPPCLWCRNFHHPKMLSCALLSGSLVSLPDSWQPLICFLLVYSSFLDFDINGVMKHVWLPSLSPELLRYIHVVTWNTTSFFFFSFLFFFCWTVSFVWINHNEFVFSTIDGNLGCVQCFGLIWIKLLLTVEYTSLFSLNSRTKMDWNGWI